MINKKIIILICILVTTTIAQAQIRFGIKGGINAGAPNQGVYMDVKYGFDSSISQAQYDSSHPAYFARIGFQFGFLTSIPLLKNGFRISKKGKLNFFTLEPEVLMSFQNYERKGLGNVNLTYINVPVLATLTFGNGFFLELGPYISFLLNATESGPKPTASQDHTSTAIGGSAGMGWKITPTHIRMDARLNIGSEVPNNLTSTPKNVNAQLDVFYLFGKRK